MLFPLFLAAASLAVGIAVPFAFTGGDPSPPSTTPPASRKPIRWTEAADWRAAGLAMPAPGFDFEIPAGQTIVLNFATPALGTLTIRGILVADPSVDVGITADLIRICDGGALRIGADNFPYARKATITLTGTPNRIVHPPGGWPDNRIENTGDVRAILVENGGTLALWGKVPNVVHTYLEVPASDTATTLQVANASDWEGADEIAIGTTDFYDRHWTVRRTLTAASSSSLTLATPLGAPRWGGLQYPVNPAINGSHLSATSHPFQRNGNQPTVLDERAPIAHLTRHIVIQGGTSENDTEWANHGNGAHVMVHGITCQCSSGSSCGNGTIRSKCQLSGVEFRRCGQRQAMGRYPIHWHMLSYKVSPTVPPTSPEPVNPDHHFLKYSTIVQSTNRAVVIHGTIGVKVMHNTAVDIAGHAFFLEDGSETQNVIAHNVAMGVRDPGDLYRIKHHDRDASGFWITNPNNIVWNNRACDAAIGIWNSFAETTFGASASLGYSASSNPTGIRPRTTPIPEKNPLEAVPYGHGRNVGHGCRLQGIITDRPVINEAGETDAVEKYDPVYPPSIPSRDGTFTLWRNSVWKNREDGYHNRAMAPTYLEWVVADNMGRDFFGATQDGAITDCLFIAQSLNNANQVPNPRNGVSSYHYAIDITRPVAIGYDATLTSHLQPGGQFLRGGGFLDASDLYIFGVAIGDRRHKDWMLLNSHPGFLTPSPRLDPFWSASPPQNDRHWTLAGAILDSHGRWGPANRYLVPSHPLYTHGSQGGLHFLNTMDAPFSSLSERFFGLQNIRAQENSVPFPRIRLQRYHTMGSSDPRTTQPSWEHHISGVRPDNLYSNFRNFALMQGGHYELDFPSGTPGYDELHFQVMNTAWNSMATDHFLLAVPWDPQASVHAFAHPEVSTVRTPITEATTWTDLTYVPPPGATTPFAGRWLRDGGRIWLHFVGNITPNPYLQPPARDPNESWLNRINMRIGKQPIPL